MKLFQIPVGAIFAFIGSANFYQMLFNQPDGVTIIQVSPTSLISIGEEVDILENDKRFNSECYYAS